MTLKPLIVGLSALLATSAAFCAQASAQSSRAKAQTVTTTYGMAVIGLPIGKASFDTVISGNRFKVQGTLSSAGLGSLVSDTRGTSSVSGSVNNRGLSADRYGLDYTSDKKRWTSKVTFSSGQVTSAKVSPKRDKDKSDYIPVRPSQLSSVVDPLSGMMIKTSDPASVCRRTLPLYDGWSRLDLQLSPGGSDAYSMSGYSGQAQVCQARVRPISGFKPSSKGLKFLSGQTLQIWFAPIARADLFVPVYARIPTQIGSLTLSATSVAVR